MVYRQRLGGNRLTEGDVNTSPNRSAWQQKHLSDETRALLARDEKVFLRQSLSTPCLDVLEVAHASKILDTDGREFLDFHGNSVHQLGHGHPKVIEAMQEALAKLPFSPRRYTNRYAIELAETLVDRAPLGLAGRSKVLLTPGATSAIGMALKLARFATGRFKTVSMWDSFHGASMDALSVGGEALFREGLGPLLPGAEHVPPADPARCILRPDGDCRACDLACARYLDYVLEKEGDVACVVAEPLRCTTVNLPPEDYWQAVRRSCDRHGALLILDETALCLGRTGKLFACEHFGATPDMVVLGKGLGGGSFPLAALIAQEDLDLAPQTALGHYTHEKSSVGSAAALAAFKVLDEEELLPRAAELGARALARLAEFSERDPIAPIAPIVGPARGLGLALGLDVLGTGETSSTDLADALLYACLSRGLSFKVSGGDTLTLTPPLTISDAELDRALDILSESLAATASA